MQLPYVEPGTYLFRFLNHNADHFWSAMADMLSEQRIYLSSRTSFNDPHDSNPRIEDDLSSSMVKAYAREMFADPWRLDRDPADIVKIMNLQAQGKTRLDKRQIENIKYETRQNTKEFLDECGLASFSLTMDEPLLWAHYAAGYSGVCVVFKRSESMQSGLSLCARVSYVDELPRLPVSLTYRMVRAQRGGEEYDELSNRIFSLSFLHKFKHWQYEQEARIYYPFSASTKISFGKDELIGIVLGPKSTSDLERRLTAEVERWAPFVRISKASLSQTDYRMFAPSIFDAA